MWFFCHADGRKIWRGDTSTPSRMAETMSLLVREAEFQRHMRRCADRLAARGAAHGRGGPHVCGQFGDSWVTFGEAFGEALGGAFGNQKTPWFLIGTIRKVRGRREAPNARRPVTLDTYKTIGTIMAIMPVMAIMAIMERVVIPAEGTDGAEKDLRDTVVFFPDTAEGFIDLTQWVRYLTTVLPKHFARTLDRQTKNITGRIEIQVPQVSGT